MFWRAADHKKSAPGAFFVRLVLLLEPVSVAVPC